MYENLINALKKLFRFKKHTKIKTSEPVNGGTLPMQDTIKLKGLSDIYRFFRKNQTPIYFVSPTAYNVLGIGQWVQSFQYVTFFDSFDGDRKSVV